MKRYVVLPITKYFKYSLGIFGLILVLISIYLLCNGFNTDSSFIKTEAKITNIIEPVKEENLIEQEYDRKIIITYIVNEREYTTEYPYWDSELDIGDYITISYNPNNPSEINARNNGFIFIASLFLIVGTSLLLYALLTRLGYITEEKRINKLIKIGIKYKGKIICVEEIEKKMSFGIVPKILLVEIEYNNKIYNLTSKNIWIKEDIRGYINHEVVIYSIDDTFTDYYIDYTEVK